MSGGNERSCGACHAADTSGIDTDKFVCWCWYYHAMVLPSEVVQHEKRGGCAGFGKPHSGLNALGTLRHPSRMCDMSASQIERERDSYKQTVAEQEAVIKELRLHIAHLTSGVPISDGTPFPPNALEMDVSEMGLSIRPFNCLWRAGLKKVRDIYGLPSGYELRSIRNLGRKSQVEVIDKMRGLGFTDWAKKMTNS